MEHTAQELSELPTLSSGYTGNLKIDDGERRVWLERTTVSDGEPYENKVTIERLSSNGRWTTVDTYPGGPIEPLEEVTVSLGIGANTIGAYWTGRDGEFTQRRFSDYSLEEIRQELSEEIGAPVTFAEPTTTY